MIYTKPANFPYPVLTNFSTDYNNAEFEFDVDLKENKDNYIFEISVDISSEFIRDNLKNGCASLVLIIKSKDNQFHILSYSEKTIILFVSKSKLCLNARTVLQLMIMTNKDMNFENNEDLGGFFQEVKKDIIVEKGMALGFSGVVIFDGSQKKPYELFEKKVDPTIKSEIEIRIEQETIVIVYRDKQFQFADIQYQKECNYPFIYMGLQKALNIFLVHVNSENPEEGVIIGEMDPPENPLDEKLYTLMKAKHITELTWSNMDEVIYQITDGLIKKYEAAIRSMQNGD